MVSHSSEVAYKLLKAARRNRGCKWVQGVFRVRQKCNKILFFYCLDHSLNLIKIIGLHT